MFNLNKVLLVGNLVRDPEVRYLPSGSAVADLRLAVSRRFKTQQGEQRDETCFISVALFGKSAEVAGQYLKKGRSIFVEGRLKFEEWEKDGKKNSRISVAADRFDFVSDGRRQDGGDGPGDARPAAASRPAAPAEGPGDEPAGPAPEGDREDLPF